MSFVELDIKQEYRNKMDNVIRNFYIPVLKQSKTYRRAVGFFSSSALLELSAGICELIKNDGYIEVIASPKLSPEDIAAINDGFRKKDEIIKEALIRELNEPKGTFEEQRLNLLSNLIAIGKLEIKIAFLDDENNIGMFHEKLGIMEDYSGNIVTFSGSMNESANSFINNYEAIDVFCSWTKDSDRASCKVSAFNSMWNDFEPGIKVKRFPEIDEIILKKYQRNNSLNTELDENDFLTKKQICNQKNNEGPFIPNDVHIRPYQNEAIHNWKEQGYCGIFDMATGTGKTYTALAAICTLFNDKKNNLAVIIVCPYQHLVEQWKEDIILFGMKPIICYSESSQKNWKERLKNAVNSFNLDIINHFSMVTTNATFSLSQVQKIIAKLKGNIVLVVDEAHNFGAKNLSKTLIDNIPYRLALSATIDRHGDPEGTQKLYDYFGNKCIEYTLKDAIDNNMLTPYYYYPIVVSLTENELEEYAKLTVSLINHIKKESNGKTVIDDTGKMLLIRRARLVAGAENKIFKLKEVIENYRNDNQLLVYCGATTLRDIDYKEGKPPIEEARQIDIVTDLLGNDLGMRVTKFTSEEKSDERERIKADFAEGKHLQALVAIRCLDEGVNIPSIRTAFILASSTNPKEYIQRRGRVLRKHSDKKHAVIYDFITLPIALNEIDHYDSNFTNIVKPLAKREIIRMKDFAAIAENPYDSDSLINNIKRVFSIEESDLEEDNYAE